jgi:hypothetical protein
MQRKVWLIDDRLSQAIDEFRFKNRFKSEADAVRCLLKQALSLEEEKCDNLSQEPQISEEIQDVDRL